MKNQRNGFKDAKKELELSPVKNACISPDIPISLLKSKGKEKKGTLNDVLMTVLSVSIREYLVTYTDDKESKSVMLGVPFSIRPAPKNELDFAFDN